MIELKPGIHGPKTIDPGPTDPRTRTEPDQGQQKNFDLGPNQGQKYKFSDSFGPSGARTKRFVDPWVNH